MTDPHETIEKFGSLIASHCVCGHSRQGHYSIGEWYMTACKEDGCDCLEFEGI